MSETRIAHVSSLVSWDELCRRLPDQWVVLVSIEWTDDRGEEILTAFVAGAGGKREALAIARPMLAVFQKLGCFHTAQPVASALPPIMYTTWRDLPASAAAAADRHALDADEHASVPSPGLARAA